jgi:hypothetical protein
MGSSRDGCTNRDILLPGQFRQQQLEDSQQHPCPGVPYAKRCANLAILQAARLCCGLPDRQTTPWRFDSPAPLLHGPTAPQSITEL